jgi:hypothetical protein
MRTKVLLLVTLLSVVESSARTASWWRSLTPDQQQPIACQIAKDDQSLARILRPLGWDAKKFPNNDWSARYVVVIAPNLFHRGYHLSFIDEQKASTSIEFRWGWVTPRTTENGLADAESYSIGESHEGKEAIVVAFPKDDLTGREYKCSETQ